MSKVQLRAFVNNNYDEYIDFCKVICDEYNGSHVDSIFVKDVLFSRDSMALFYGTIHLMK